MRRSFPEETAPLDPEPRSKRPCSVDANGRAAGSGGGFESERAVAAVGAALQQGLAKGHAENRATRSCRRDEIREGIRQGCCQGNTDCRAQHFTVRLSAFRPEGNG